MSSLNKGIIENFFFEIKIIRLVHNYFNYIIIDY